ncbi:endonuclease/exonuclease/phosphatase family metal-dependent hydrolase [Roseibium hamelinense]|uniref:Endonuclease/exonuclease/phosphatase family metal-dependent hydrolase n=1 Tax=Roseibium hamelinense TaxID=150831 RepID=A0A562TGI0_9HYPH|nr:endonuclease/exonuclease/phosphatase family protein [Roseibium hamelinense]MTI46118.1 endonuclease [Roseibium hamelinense]TWI92689.1 endonuclease/exonuclease/phosphatase family metal-dependent hydrolase [Roseibium hamelinense]
MLKIGSYNIQKSIGVDGRRRPERTLQVLTEMDCDIIALQEADKRFGPRETTLRPELIAEKTDYKPVPIATREASIGWHGNAILVRNTVSIIDFKRLELPTLEPRGAVMADLKINGSLVRVAAMHLSVIATYRKRQISSLMHQLHSHTYDLPTVLVGDLNEWWDTATSLKLFRSHYEVTSPGKSFPSPMPLASLDRIVTSPEFSVLEAGVHRSKTARVASDHLPVWARLKLNAGPDDADAAGKTDAAQTAS